MKAAFLTQYGGPDTIEIREIEKPSVGDDDILIKTIATTVTQVDNIFRSGDQFFARIATGVLKPKIPVLGTELSGVVEEVGKNVTAFKPGDEVIADSGTNYGAHAEYVLVSEKDPVIKKPEGMSFSEAAALSYGGLTALSFLTDTAKLKSGQSILVLGGSGSVGSYAIQIAKYLGAHVTGVSSGKNTGLVTSLGADDVLDYTKNDVRNLDNRFDVIFDTVGKYSFGQLKHLLKGEGLFMTTDLSFGILVNMALTSVVGKKKANVSFTGLNSLEDKLKGLSLLVEIYEQGKIKPLIDQTFDFENIVDAHKHVATGRKKGNVIVNFSDNGGHND
jgi:NADPH:quinone reductase-like Zn-dependent oxidoreductase